MWIKIYFKWPYWQAKWSWSRYGVLGKKLFHLEMTSKMVYVISRICNFVEHILGQGKIIKQYILKKYVYILYTIILADK